MNTYYNTDKDKDKDTNSLLECCEVLTDDVAHLATRIVILQDEVDELQQNSIAMRAWVLIAVCASLTCMIAWQVFYVASFVGLSYLASQVAAAAAAFIVVTGVMLVFGVSFN